jgi:hypothetical protein
MLRLTPFHMLRTLMRHTRRTPLYPDSIQRCVWFAAPTIFKLRLDYKGLLFVDSFFFAFLCFFITFFLSINISTTSWTTRPLFDDLEGRIQGNPHLPTILSIFVLPWLTFAFCMNGPLFLSRSNGMTADIGSMAPGMDEDGPGLGIGTKGITKNIRSPAHFFHCRFCSHYTAKQHYSLAYFRLCTTTDTFTPLTGSFYRQSLGH